MKNVLDYLEESAKKYPNHQAIIHHTYCSYKELLTDSQKNWNYARHNAIIALANELEVDFVDLNLIDLGIDWKKDTRDQGDHVNYSGSIKVSNYLGSYLQEKYQFKDHSNDCSWKEDLIDYDNYLQKHNGI